MTVIVLFFTLWVRNLKQYKYNFCMFTQSSESSLDNFQTILTAIIVMRQMGKSVGDLISQRIEEGVLLHFEILLVLLK